MIRGVDTFSGLLLVLFPVCGHLWPSEETEHITDHHDINSLSSGKQQSNRHINVVSVGD